MKDVPEADVEIYKTWAGGDARHLKGVSDSLAMKCAVLLFQTYGDGYYEISMKTGEVHHRADRKNNRTFSILLNDIYIVREFVVEKYRTSPNGLELVANFRIFENKKLLELQGHPPKEIERSDGKLQLDICHSSCDSKKVGFRVDRNWVMYGLSIIKFTR